ncbi:hypothetical protein NHX12_024462 [Muraenolepis orangiensis]|uniref:EamA domain-containing protein n=1 Tax=Muraenolepis orangiensis TaxID=630683 RepID=A0A9Q0EKE6_9TELE|nr:hypothetical protein NHX12_024462 [Muraenolepis orangiensis]
MDNSTDRGDGIEEADRAVRVVPRRTGDVTVVFQKVDDNNEDDDDDDGERTAERIVLQTNSRVPCDEDDDDDEKEEKTARTKTTRLCPPALCFKNRHVVNQSHPRATFGVVVSASEEEEEKKTIPGLGLFYGFLSTVFFSIISLLVKTIQGVHSIEISAIRCFFQMLFIVPLLIYHRDKRVFLVLRGFLGSNAMILLFYAVQQMPLADATVIMFR